MKNILFHCESYQSFALNLGLLLFRAGVGLTMAFSHGIGKVPPPEQLINGITSMGLPMPIVMAWCAALAEFLGGLGIAAGLFTRLAAASLSVTMAVAFFIVHANDPLQSKELALLYLFSSTFIFMSGAGKFSIDALICKK